MERPLLCHLLFSCERAPTHPETPPHPRLAQAMWAVADVYLPNGAVPTEPRDARVAWAHASHGRVEGSLTKLD
eukprot:CAMPEP_0195576230 /NCGR_PEP_ID=MMETSP0814-20130614/8502_1 /TAXON_ID=97485 /ORGANISM="Prymnesium parvum, Strain Texoma1" /LENGTH=72 /DNA_ID=CAMNT_0040712461 /DNA_START=428 /DNA_END=643 /DNA_ORIENTATION=+